MDWRKSWAYENIYGKNGKGEGTKRSLLPDERSVWDDYLDLAALNTIPGQVSITPRSGYTIQQLADLLRTPEETITRATKKLQNMGSIILENNGIIVILNWKMYQTEWERIKGYTTETTAEPTRKPTTQNKNKNIDIDNRYRRKEYKNMYSIILSHWNSKKIIVHKYIDSYTYGRINSKLDHGFTIEDVKQAIDNYAYILKSKAYFFTHEWTLGEFLQRGFDKFLDLEGAKKRYAGKEKDTVEEEVHKFLRSK